MIWIKITWLMLLLLPLFRLPASSLILFKLHYGNSTCNFEVLKIFFHVVLLSIHHLTLILLSLTLSPLLKYQLSTSMFGFDGQSVGFLKVVFSLLDDAYVMVCFTPGSTLDYWVLSENSFSLSIHPWQKMLNELSLDSISEDTIPLDGWKGIWFKEFGELLGHYSTHQFLMTISLNFLLLPQCCNLLVILLLNSHLFILHCFNTLLLWFV